jgi:tetratricopeptide (TPR) repeat protein
VAEANPAVSHVGNNLAFGLSNLADLLIAVGRPAEALEALAEARPILRRVAEADSARTTFIRNLASNYRRTGQALALIGMWREAEEAFGTAVAIRRKLADAHPADDALRSGPADVLGVFGSSLRTSGRAAEALSVFSLERTLRQGLAAASAGAANRAALANSESNVAAALLVLDRTSEARACCDRAIAIGEDLVKGEPKNGDYARGLAASLLRSGSVRSVAGDSAGAAADWHRAAALYDRHPPTKDQAILRASCHASLAGLAGAEGSGVTAEEAATQADQAMVILREGVAHGYRDVNLLRAEPSLVPLRRREDFRMLMMDLDFPAEPCVVRVDKDFRPVPAPLITTAPAEKP